MKKSERKRLVARLDAVFSQYIRERDKRCCTKRSSCSDVLQCGHLFTRASYATRWDERYAFAQCSSHNYLHESHPEIMTDWFIRKFGLGAYQEGVKVHHKIKKFTDQQLRDLIDYYKSKI